MKQFNLNEYLANPSRKIVTRDGKPVRIICTDAKGNAPIIGLVSYENSEAALNATKDGIINGVLDLFFTPEKETEEPIITCDNIPLNWSLGKLKAKKFDVSTLAPFNKVLTRNNLDDTWRPNFFGYINNEFQHRNISCFGFCWKYCIPYNEETQHLVGTKDDCPEYYKWWEE